MSKEEQNLIDYLVVCVNEFAERLGLSYKEAFNYLYEYKAVQFVKENYEIEHTLSLEDVLEDMILVAKKHGGNLV